MQVNEITFSNQLPIDAYGPGFFRVDEKVLSGPVFVTPSGVRAWQGLEDFEPLIQSQAHVDVLLIGMGPNLVPLSRALRDALDHAEVPYEIMSSPSACRTFNVLLSEGRRVAVAAIPV
ncbi:membrane protein [Amylibacter marinus]|uniref:Membrane protein n=1 Tax=Amylibacter marinus TaxID=1475483 RepID=A0ABQ5VTH2_9RHOB|nr:Mth938-like domain-containing protein [Amylibacter marinus]GLQ34733.1 membrane protein [Amylibacter marinus]